MENIVGDNRGISKLDPFRRHHRRDVVFGVIVDRSIKPILSTMFTNFFKNFWKKFTRLWAKLVDYGHRLCCTEQFAP